MPSGRTAEAEQRQRKSPGKLQSGPPGIAELSNDL
jgi:hypothetical protein